MKIKILLFGSYPPPYHGTSVYLKGLTRILSDSGRFTVFTVNSSDKRDNLSNLGRIDFVNVYSALKAIIRLVFVLLFNRVDVVYVPISQNKLGYLRDGFAILFGKVFGGKVVIHLHGSYFLQFYENSSNVYKKFVDLTIKASSGVIVLGRNLKFIFERWLSKDKIFVLPNFVINNVDPDDKSRVELNNRNLVRLTYLSNFYESKGLLDLLAAARLLINNNKNVILQLAGKFGDDPMTGMRGSDIKQIVFDAVSRYPANVRYLGYITDISMKYGLLKNHTDIFILPSWNEGQPLAILEAMQFGLPIISTKDCGAVEEIVKDGFNGILVEKKNVKQLAQAIQLLVDDRQLRKKMGENSLRLYKENFTPERHLEKFEEILKSVLTQ